MSTASLSVSFLFFKKKNEIQLRANEVVPQLILVFVRNPEYYHLIYLDFEGQNLSLLRVLINFVFWYMYILEQSVYLRWLNGQMYVWKSGMLTGPDFTNGMVFATANEYTRSSLSLCRLLVDLLIHQQ